ncbi:hypothetical protein [Chryseobacterium sp. T16E-39]|uniref:hypothetical protein n=1 Tax=Chryseobacterium sp. T16E-39 TaxID=2015076 RepID=UPI0012FA0250|nr:hypothetical protein [Chryseobacterium sp. T16E-39]
MNKEEMLEVNGTQKMKNNLQILRSILLIFFIGSFTMNCKKESQEGSPHSLELEKDSIQPMLAKQLKAGAEKDYGSFKDYTQKDLNALIEVQKVILDQSNFKPLSNEDFIKRIEYIFGIKVDRSSSLNYIKINMSDKCDQKLSYKPFTLASQDLYISKKDRLITYFYSIPEILEYTNLFPDLKSLEASPIKYSSDDGEMYAKRWRDIADLTELRSRNIMITASINKYISNDDRSALTWLLGNDKDFLKKLVAEYGYDKEEKINSLVLQSFFEEYAAENEQSGGKLGRIVFVKNCAGKLEIRKGLLDYIEKNTTENNDKYITSLGDYIISYLYKEDNNKFTPVEKAEIVAYISNIEGPAFHKFKGKSDNAWSQAATPLFFLQSKTSMNQPEVLQIIKKNKYFGLQPLKNYIESGQLQQEDPSLIKNN